MQGEKIQVKTKVIHGSTKIMFNSVHLNVHTLGCHLHADFNDSATDEQLPDMKALLNSYHLNGHTWLHPTVFIVTLYSVTSDSAVIFFRNSE